MMRKITPTYFTLVLSLILLGSCQKQEHTISLYIDAPDYKNSNVSILKFEGFEQTPTIESKTDSMGICRLNFKLDEPLFAMLSVGQRFGEVYLTPESDLTIAITGSDYKIPFKFQGNGAELNNYLCQLNSITEQIKWLHGQGIYGLNKDEFLHRLDSIRNLFETFTTAFYDSTSLSPELLDMLEVKRRIKLQSVAYEYNFYWFNDNLNQRIEAIQNRKEFLNQVLPKELETLMDNTPFDTTYLMWGEYQMLMNFYWRNKINIPVIEQMILEESSTDSEAIISNSIIKQTNLPESIKEYLTAFDLAFWLARQGITTATDSVYNDFKRNYKISQFSKVLDKSYQEWLAIAPGNSAPELNASAIDGKGFSLDDLKGKVVYIDVWATWCAPCKEEIPMAKVLYNKFGGDGSIEFLNISVDRDRKAWEKFLENDKTWKGIHVILDSENLDSFYKSFKLFGVPDYFLIDKNGKIITLRAPRPSNKQVYEVIEKQLSLARQ